MTAIDIIIWWTGVVVWGVAGLASMLFAGERILDWVLLRLCLKRDFLLWAMERIKARTTLDAAIKTTED